MSNDKLTPRSHFSRKLRNISRSIGDPIPIPRASFSGRTSLDNQFKKLKNELRNEKRKWNVFEETGTQDISASERRYDKSLQKKYKYLKVFSNCLFDSWNLYV